MAIFKPDRFQILILSAVALAGLAGCQTTMVQKSAVTEHAGNSADEQLEFWHSLNDIPIASNDDAFHAVLLYLDGTDSSTDYAGRVASLKGRGMLPANFSEPANQSIQRGTFAVALVKVLQMRGGLMMHLVGPIPRYAVRELYSEGVYPLSSPNQTFSGAELVGVIGRVEDYQRGNPNGRPATQLPSDPEAPITPE